MPVIILVHDRQWSQNNFELFKDHYYREIDSAETSHRMHSISIDHFIEFPIRRSRIISENHKNFEHIRQLTSMHHACIYNSARILNLKNSRNLAEIYTTE